MARIPLEDNFTDILGKAQRGLGLNDQALASHAGISVRDLHRLKTGQVLEPMLRQVATALQLGPEALVQSAKQAWYPNPADLAGLAQFTTPYGGMLVNAYVVWDAQSKEVVMFDTGADIDPVLQFIKNKGLVVKLILLTHSHSDHVIKLSQMKEATRAPAYINEKDALRGAEGFVEGRSFRAGALEIETRLTSGHSEGGTTYVVTGLARPVAIVGDALFAGSMGRGLVSYTDALANNRQKILTLPEDTIVCPGHGPLTTVGEERLHNPFFPEFQNR